MAFRQPVPQAHVTPQAKVTSQELVTLGPASKAALAEQPVPMVAPGFGDTHSVNTCLNNSDAEDNNYAKNEDEARLRLRQFAHIWVRAAQRLVRSQASPDQAIHSNLVMDLQTPIINT